MKARAVARPRAKTAAQMLGHPFGLGLALGVLFFAGLWASGALAPAERRPHHADRVAWRRRPGPRSSRLRPRTCTRLALAWRRRRIPQDAPGEPRPVLSPDVGDLAFLKLRGLLLPAPAADARRLRDDFADPRTGHSHEALDILAPRGSPVLAVDDGVVQKLFTSVRGGLTVYQFDPEGTYCYYYAHLDRYAPGLHEGMTLKKGDRIGDVGITGNAPPQTPHLHFAIFKLGPEKQWWKGAALNPYPLWGPAPARAD